MKRVFILTTCCLLTMVQAFATDYYVSTTGSDTNEGKSREAAFATLGKAQSLVTAGDNVYILPGTYQITESQISATSDPYKIVFNFKQNGTLGKPIRFIGLTEGGQRPVFDMSAVNPTGFRVTAFYVTGSYLVFRNFDVIGVMVNITDHTQSENFRIRNGHHNTFDDIACHLLVDAEIAGKTFPLIQKIAKKNKLDVIDLHTPTSNHPELFPDKLHPNAEGERIIAETIFQYMKKNIR